MSAKLITAYGLTMTVCEWAEKQGVKPKTIHSRLARGKTGKDAILKHVRTKSECGALGKKKSAWRHGYKYAKDNNQS